MNLRTALALFVSLLLVTTCAWPQASTGTVSGTVRDQSGAVIPNVPVTITNTGTNVSIPGRTNEAGRYYFPGVSPGTYRIVVESPGMRKYEATFTVQVQQSVVIDPVLTPGETTTTIEVTDVTPMVVTDNATVGHVLERARVEQLPIASRDLKVLLSAMPEIENVRAFGAPEGSMEFVLDGAPMVNRRWANHATMQGMLDSIQEFRVETSTPSAKYSRPASVVMSTKSGSNEFHGTAFETHRNNAIGLARRREQMTSDAPKYIRNEFGLSGGGPVILPKIYDGRNKTFWFAAWETSRTVRGVSQSFNVPTLAMRQGDFSGLQTSDGWTPVLYDPWSTGPAENNYARVPFAEDGVMNKIPLSRMSPVAKYLFSVTPEPTTADNPLVARNWYGTYNRRSIGYNFSMKVDHHFSEKDQIYVRYSQKNSTDNEPFSSQRMLNDAVGYTALEVPTKTLSFNYVRTISPTFFNELNISGYYSRYYNEPPVITPPDGYATWQDYLGMPNPFNSSYFPKFTELGIGNYAFNNNAPQNYHNGYIVIDDNATKLIGKHELQFGFHYRYDQNNQFPQQWHAEGMNKAGTGATALYDPSASTPTNPVALNRTGHNIANLFIGQLIYESWMNRGWYNMRERDYALYINDTYRVTPRLTLNLGLRWEYWPVPRDKYNGLVTFDPATKTVVTGAPLEEFYRRMLTVPSVVARYQEIGAKFADYKTAGFPETLMTGSKGDFGPRAGFAYRALEGKKALVLRGGYSLSYYPVPSYKWMDNDRGNVPFNAGFVNNPTSAAQTPDGLPNLPIRSIPTIVAGVNSRDAVTLDKVTSISRGTGSMQYFGPDLPTSRVHSWNFTIEKEIMEYTVTRVRYVGNKGSNLEQYYNYNNAPSDYIWYVTTGQPKPTGEFAPVAMRPFDQTTFGTLREFRKTGYTRFNGMEFEVERRYHKGVGFQLAYIVGNTMTNMSDVPDTSVFLPGAVPSDYEERSRFLNYRRDTGIPKHRVKWNFLVDLPFGRGKPLLSNIHPVVDKVVGGWQLSGIGTIRSNYFSLPTGIYPTTGNPIEIYGYKYPIQDCRSGVCQPGYLWWNGYIPPHQINTPNGIMGVPENYKPAGQPLIPHGDPNYPTNLHGTNTTWVTLQNGQRQQVTYNDNLHPWRNQYFPANRTWNMDASLVKNIPIWESISARFSADFFNVFNNPGNPTSISQEGILNTRNSGQDPRSIQLSLRLHW
ncbi:MAG TPA: TonB-dependent receptor [Bryobacteraceae bacterium]|nr:TonB-dependent receptor [Bryobacteraceae bacterium]HPU73054.1 TonB-dependent receptor [Bryobacteraceae bacterium]